MTPAMTCTAIDIREAPAGGRRDDVRRTLVERQRELMNEIQNRVRDIREVGGNKGRHLTDFGDTVEAESEDDLAFAVIHMKAQALQRVEEALRRFDEGTYGFCVECADAIAPSRLRAMPFAVRCRECEERREDEQNGLGVRSRLSSGAR